MLLTNGSLLFSNPGAFLTMLLSFALVLLIGITIHEFSHALIAYRLGDTTAVGRGRLSLDPRVHLDPVGTAMVLIVGFGWGKPVPVDPSQLRNGRRGLAMVSIAGPMSNILMAAAFALPFQFGLMTVPAEWPPQGLDPGMLPAYIAVVGVFLNLVLAIFNLLPMYPLDGSAILLGVTPSRWTPIITRLQVLGPVVLGAVILLDFTFGYGILWSLMGPVVNWATTILIG